MENFSWRIHVCGCIWIFFSMLIVYPEKIETWPVLHILLARWISLLQQEHISFHEVLLRQKKFRQHEIFCIQDVWEQRKDFFSKYNVIIIPCYMENWNVAIFSLSISTNVSWVRNWHISSLVVCTTATSISSAKSPVKSDFFSLNERL